MAIVKKTNEDENQDQGMNVLGEQPQMDQNQQQAQTPAETGVNVSGGPSATIQAGSQGQTQQAQQQPAGASKKGSGMFTDLRKYVKANQSQAGNLAGAVSKDFGQETKKIQQEVAQKQKSFQERVAEQRARQDQAQTFAQQQLQQAGTQGLTPEEQDIQKFQKLMSGEQSFSNVGQLAIAPQQVEAQKLARQAALSERATGASDLLRQTFADKGQYTRGQQALDSLILGGDQGARNQLVQDIQGQAQQLTGGLRDARTSALAQAGELTRSGQDFRKGLQESLTSERERVLSDIDAEIERQRESMLRRQDEFIKGLEEGTITREQLENFLDMNQLQSQAQAMEAARKKGLTTLGELSGQDKSGYWGRTYGDQGSQLTASNLFDRANLGWHGELGGYIHSIGNQLKEIGYDKADVQAAQNQYAQKQADAETKAQVAANAQISKIASDELISQGIKPDTHPDYFDQALSQRIESIKKNNPSQYESIFQSQMRAQGFDPNLDPNVGAIQQLLGNQKFTREGLIDEFLTKGQTEGNEFLNLLKRTDLEELNRQTVATEQDIARQAALAALAGRQGEGAIKKIEGPSLSGTFNLADALRMYRRYR